MTRMFLLLCITGNVLGQVGPEVRWTVRFWNEWMHEGKSSEIVLSSGQMYLFGSTTILFGEQYDNVIWMPVSENG